MIKHIMRISLACLLVLAVSGTAFCDNKAYWVDTASGAAVSQLDLAAGQESVIRLMAEVPEGKTLKAYSLMITYDEGVISVEDADPSPDSPLPPANINTKEAGSVVVNGFKVSGVEGKNAVAVVDLNVKGLSAATCDLSVFFSAFGASAADEFKPKSTSISVNVR